jgi:hypothetical protein
MKAMARGRSLLAGDSLMTAHRLPAGSYKETFLLGKTLPR